MSKIGPGLETWIRRYRRIQVDLIRDFLKHDLNKNKPKGKKTNKCQNQSSKIFFDIFPRNLTFFSIVELRIQTHDLCEFYCIQYFEWIMVEPDFLEFGELVEYSSR